MVQGSRVARVHVWAYSSPQGQAEQRRNRRRDDTAADPGIEVIFFSVWGSADEDVRSHDRYGLPRGNMSRAARGNPNDEARMTNSGGPALRHSDFWFRHSRRERAGGLSFAALRGARSTASPARRRALGLTTIGRSGVRPLDVTSTLGPRLRPARMYCPPGASPRVRTYPCRQGSLE
jgi:hypothetical protein